MIGRTFSKVMFVFVAGFLLICSEQRVAAQSIPPGSYQQTCSSINVKGNRLSAYCRAKDGSSTLSSLNNFKLCEGDIWNNDGSLTCKKPVTPTLKLRDFLYFLGKQHGSISHQTKAIKKFTSATVSTSDAASCSNNICTFYLGFVVERKPAKDFLRPFGHIVVLEGGGTQGEIGNTVILAPGKYTQEMVLPVQLRVGSNKLKVAVDPKNEISEGNELDNRFTVTIIVKQ